MICPFCVEDVPVGTTQHFGCKRHKDGLFPELYIKFHGKEGAPDPVIISVVGFPGHGKTVYLCALFNFFDNVLTSIWPGFFSKVLDQTSMDTLRKNRDLLRKGELPASTDAKTFPRPGIFRLIKMPPSQEWSPIMPVLADTTILIYDPPGEAFSSDDKIDELASFVKRSSCVLFLIDITRPWASVADEMSDLLSIYTLGMKKKDIEEKSQHLIVVFTKSDVMKSAVPGFDSYLESHPDLKQHLKKQVPETLKDPNAHQECLNEISEWLRGFTWKELKAYKFVNEATDFFKSVSYTAVSSLGAAPVRDEAGHMGMTAEMSPRCVADPVLFVLAKSIPIKKRKGLPLWIRAVIERWL